MRLVPRIAADSWIVGALEVGVGRLQDFRILRDSSTGRRDQPRRGKSRPESCQRDRTAEACRERSPRAAVRVAWKARKSLLHGQEALPGEGVGLPVPVV